MFSRPLQNKYQRQKFKKEYSNNKIRTVVIDNITYYPLMKLSCDTQAIVNNHEQFVNDHKSYRAIKYYATNNIKLLLGNTCDFTFIGNRKYYMYVIEHNGRTFMVPSKIELVLFGDTITDNDVICAIQFERAWSKFTLEYMHDNLDTLDEWDRKVHDEMYPYIGEL